MSRPRFQVPHTLVLLFAMIVLAQLATYALPHGAFERETNEVGREEVVAGSYAELGEPAQLPWHASLTSIPKGFEAAAEIIFFVFIVGGAFAVLRRTGAVDALIGWLLARLAGRPALLVTGGVLLFGIGSSTIGMAEEYLPFIPVLLVLCRGLGFDAITAVGILCVGYGVGYGAAAMNPFTLLIAQDVAGLEPVSGLGFRLALFVVFAAVGVHHVLAYAKRVHASPAASYVADVEAAHPEPSGAHPSFTGTHRLILAVLVGMLVLLVYAIKVWGWYLHEMMALFLGLSILLGIVARLGADTTAKAFCEGAAELTTTALLIGFARSIQVVLDDGQVVDTIVYNLSQPLEALGSAGAGVGMFFFQSLANFFIPSGSGQAYVTMPLMAPLADLVGVSRQVAVLAFQFGDGFTNILVPTNAVLVGILGLAGIPYDRWLRFVLPFMVKMWLLGSVAIVVAVAIGYS